MICINNVRGDSDDALWKSVVAGLLETAEIDT